MTIATASAASSPRNNWKRPGIEVPAGALDARASTTSAAKDRGQAGAFGVVGLVGRGADGFVEGVGVVADEDAPAVLAHAVEDDRRSLRGRGRRVVAEHLAHHPDELAQLIVGHALTRHAAALQAGPERLEVVVRHRIGL